MFLVVTRSFPPEIGGMQILIGELSESLLNHGPVKVFAYEFENSKIFDNNSHHKKMFKKTCREYYQYSQNAKLS